MLPPEGNTVKVAAFPAVAAQVDHEGAANDHSGGGAVDHESGAGWITGRAPLKSCVPFPP